MLRILGAVPLHRWIQVFFFALALILWPVAAELEVFEQFYYYSRDHEDWDLDELVLLALNLTAALLASYIIQAVHLRRAIRAQAEERLRADQNARHDPLTGLKNRRAFVLALGERCAARDRVVAVMDLDRFKPVNDLHGHAAGDTVLRVVAERLESSLSSKAMVARLGGDEFAVLFNEDVPLDRVEPNVRQALACLRLPIEHEDLRLTVDCSIGLARAPCDEAGSVGLLHADKALYSVKRQGRGRIAWYDADLDAASQERARIEADLREAIRRNHIIPYFQPVFVIETGQLRGFEVLSRWSHPTRGDVPPGVFIEVAEECGMIAELGWSVIAQACEAAVDWDDTLKIAVNISPQQFLDRSLADRIDEILSEAGLPAHRLEIEITESAVIQDLQSARDTIARLRAKGISIALDDFGTGYSSLASLRELDFDRLKIDRGFVTNIMEHPENQKIVSGIMALANGLDLDVTAEGIETDADLSFLTELRCSLGQGYLFDRAVPAEDVLWLMETRWRELSEELPRKDGETPSRHPAANLAI